MSPVCSVSNVSKEWIILWSNWFKWFKASKSLVCPITRNQEVKTEEKSSMLWRQTGDELVNWHCSYTGKLMIDDETQLGATGADDHCWWGGVAGRWVETHTAAGERQSRVWQSESSKCPLKACQRVRTDRNVLTFQKVSHFHGVKLKWLKIGSHKDSCTRTHTHTHTECETYV